MDFIKNLLIKTSGLLRRTNKVSNGCVQCNKRAGSEFNNGTELYLLGGRVFCSLECFYGFKPVVSGGKKIMKRKKKK